LAFLDEPANFTFPEPDSISVHCYRNDRGLDVHCIKLPVFVDVVTSELASPRAVMGGLSIARWRGRCRISFDPGDLK
jgi:hypothetical protein